MKPLFGIKPSYAGGWDGPDPLTDDGVKKALKIMLEDVTCEMPPHQVDEFVQTLIDNFRKKLNDPSTITYTRTDNVPYCTSLRPDPVCSENEALETRVDRGINQSDADEFDSTRR